MNICIIAMEYPFTLIDGERYEDCSAGGGAIMRDIAIGLQSKGHNVCIVSVTSNPKLSGTFYDNCIYVKKIYTPNPILQPLLVTKFIKQLCKDKNIDIIETNDFNPLLYEYIKDIPILLRQHISYAYLKFIEQTIDSPYNIQDYEKLIRSYALLIADSISGVSEYIQSTQAMFHNIPTSKLYGVIPNGVPILYDEDKEISPHTIFCHGTMSSRKGTSDVCKIFESIHHFYNDTRLVLIGNNSQYFDVYCKNDIAPNILDKIQCFQALPRAECINKISKYGIYISMSKLEAMSLSLLEAMALKKPVIVLKNGCFENIVEHKVNGFVVNNSEEAIHYATQLLHNKELYEEISNKALEKSKEFTIDRTIDETENWYRYVLKNRSVFIKKRDYNYENLLKSYYNILSKIINTNTLS